MTTTTTTTITTKDIELLVNIIDLCSQRGAFKGEELELIGSMRKKLINANKAAMDQTQEDFEIDNTPPNKGNKS